MKPTLTIPSDILENSAAFTDDFYKRFALRKAPRPLQLTDSIAKDYQFPTFYGNVTCAQAIFLCPYETAAALVADELHPSITPVRMPKRRAVVAFSCYEYRNVMGVPPYNEVAVAIPVMADPAFSPPVLPLLLPVFRRFGYFIAAMPVTSQENRIRGNKIWGLPKVTQEIDVRREGDDCVTTASEPDGSEYFRLVVPTKGKPVNFDVRSHLFSRLDGKLLRSMTAFRAQFAVQKFMGVLFNPGTRPDRKWLTIGTTPSAEILNRLRIEEQPFQLRYAETMSSCFDLPDEKPPAWLAVLNAHGGGLAV